MALAPRVMTVGHFMTTDEYLWLNRTGTFSDALAHGEFSKMSAGLFFPGTMPGIPTLWLGSLGRLIWSGAKHVGLADGGTPFTSSFVGFAFAQTMVAIATAVLVGVLVWLMCQWVSRRAGVVTGLVIATEPFWVAHGSVLHTDELTTLFGLAGTIAIAWVLGIPTDVTPPRRPMRWAAISGVLLVCSPLTKLSGFLFLPPVAGMLIYAWVRNILRRNDGVTIWQAGWTTVRLAIVIGGAAIVTTAVLYPSLWLAPVAQFRLLQHANDIVTTDRITYFNGHLAKWPSLWFYPVNLAYRSTPWMLIAIPVGTVVSLVRRETRARAAIMMSCAIVSSIALLVTMAHYDRYGLLVLGPASVLVGLACTPRTVSDRPIVWPKRLITLVGIGALSYTMVIAPWGLAYYNPILTRIEKPERVVRIGWGESSSLILPIISADAHAHGTTCRQVSVATLVVSSPVLLRHTCAYKPGTAADADYLAIGISYQQLSGGSYRQSTKGRVLVGTGTMLGVPQVQVWRKVDAFKP